MYLLYNFELTKDMEACTKAETKRLFEHLFDSITEIKFNEIPPLKIAEDVRSWCYTLNDWIQREKIFGHLNKLTIEEYQVIDIKFYFSRFERKRFVMLVFEWESKKSVLEEIFEEAEESIYKIISSNLKTLLERKMVRINQTLILKFKNGKEAYTVMNPALLMSCREICRIDHTNFNKIVCKKFTLLDLENYVPESSPLHECGEIFIKATYNCIFISQTEMENEWDHILDIIHSEYLAVTRMAAYQSDMEVDLKKLFIIERVAEILQKLWVRVMPVLTIGEKGVIRSPYKKIIYALIDINHMMFVISTDIGKNLLDKTNEYEERYNRIRLTFERIDKENLGKYFTEFCNRFSSVMESVRKRNSILAENLSQIVNYTDRMKDTINIYENFNLQVIMLVLTIIVSFWGVFALGYDKIVCIDGSNIKTEIVYMSVFPIALVSVTAIVALITVIFLRLRVRKSIPNYPRKLVKLSEKAEDNYFIKALNIIENPGITRGKYNFGTRRYKKKIFVLLEILFAILVQIECGKINENVENKINDCLEQAEREQL